MTNKHAELIEELREDYCQCIEGYTSRGMVDPQCESCNTKDLRNRAADALESAAVPTEHCQSKTMGEHACYNRRQCWEPCGELGHSAEHVSSPSMGMPASAKPLPLTTIVMLSMDYQITGSTHEIARFARAIESAHEIKEQP